MGTNPILRATSNALAGNTLTNLAASSGQGLGALIESGDTETAWDVFLEALGKQEQENESIPMPLQMGANALSSTLPQSRILKGIDQAKNLIEGGGFLKDNSKQDVHVGQKKFPSTKPKGLEKEGKKQGLANARDVVLKLTDGHTAMVESAGSDATGLTRAEIILRNPEGKRYARMVLGRDSDGTIVVQSNFPMKDDMPESEALKMGSGKSKELRNILAKKLGGIGSDPNPTNSAAGTRSYYSDPNVKRVFPEELDTQSRVDNWKDYLSKPRENQSRFFTPGNKKQANDFDVAVDAVYGGAPMTDKWLAKVLPQQQLKEGMKPMPVQTMTPVPRRNDSEDLTRLTRKKQNLFDIGLNPETKADLGTNFRVRAVRAADPSFGTQLSDRKYSHDQKLSDAFVADQKEPFGPNRQAAFQNRNADLDNQLQAAGYPARLNQPWDEFLSNLRPAQNMTPVPPSQERPGDFRMSSASSAIRSQDIPFVNDRIEALTNDKNRVMFGMGPARTDAARTEYRIGAINSINPELGANMNFQNRAHQPRLDGAWREDGMPRDGSIGPKMQVVKSQRASDLDSQMDRAGLDTRMNQTWDEFLANINLRNQNN